MNGPSPSSTTSETQTSCKRLSTTWCNLSEGTVNQLGFFFDSEDPDGPNLYTANVPLPGMSESWHTTATRYLNAIRYVPFCADVNVVAEDPIDLTLITADKVVTAVDDLLPQLRADSITDVQ